MKKVNETQDHEQSGLLLCVTPIAQESLQSPPNQVKVVVHESDGGGEGSDGSEGTGDY